MPHRIEAPVSVQVTIELRRVEPSQGPEVVTDLPDGRIGGQPILRCGHHLRAVARGEHRQLLQSVEQLQAAGDLPGLLAREDQLFPDFEGRRAMVETNDDVRHAHTPIMRRMMAPNPRIDQ